MTISFSYRLPLTDHRLRYGVSNDADIMRKVFPARRIAP